MSRTEVIWGITGTVIGATVGFVVGRTVLEAKVRGEYAESAEAFRNAMLMAQKVEPEAPEEHEEQLDLFEEIRKTESYTDILTEDGRKLASQREDLIAEGVDPKELLIPSAPTIELPSDNPYHSAVTLDDIVPHVEGGINDYGMSYIEEEDYQDEDGRVKARIDIMMDDHNTIFLEDGVQIDDWDAKIGDSILVDFFRLCPPGSDGILYVRNHRTDVDYEVVRVVP